MNVYKDIIFGKGYEERCKNVTGNQIKNYKEDGRKLIIVNIILDDPRISFKDFDTKYEAYKLSVDKEGNVQIHADYYPGLLRGLDTFAQLTERVKDRSLDFYLKYLPIKVNDEPKYSYRGLLLDTSKEYYDVDTLKQLFDGMMISHLNVFHWHFMDSDSFPVVLKSYPNMTDYTAFSKDEVYTAEMIKDIITYANSRGISVIPGISGPGHVNALGMYPQFKDHIE